MTPDVGGVARHFMIPGDFASAAPYGSGHINDTFAAVFDQAGTRVRYIFQRMNTSVFKEPFLLMENVRLVTEHQRRKLLEAGCPDAGRRALTLLRTLDGKACHRDAEGGVWRAYLFIENASTFDSVRDPAQAYEAARAFGRFMRQVRDLPAGGLRETIPDFHNTPKRFEAFERAARRDAAGRAALAGPQIAFAMERRGMCGALLEKHAAGLIPSRVTHNDTKLNNVLMDDATGEGICVIDLDTVMPGLSLYDFGDMVRTATCPRPEDERDLSKVRMEMPLFQALARGFLESAHSALTPAERECMAFSGRLITFEIGLRFLTDFLEGDVYFKVHRPGHNLDRCRSQFKLAESIREQEDEMNRFVASWEPRG
jgi:hypothetical protein